MDAQKVWCVARLQFIERGVQDSGMRTVTYFCSALKYSTCASALGAAPVLDQQHLAVVGCGGCGLCGAGALRFGQCLLLAAHGFGQVVHRVQPKSAHGVLGVGCDKDQCGRVGQRLQGVRQTQAVLPGHVDVQQHHVKGDVHAGGCQCRARAGLGGSGCLAQLVGRARRGDVCQQGAQAAARQRLVVNDQDVHSRRGGRAAAWAGGAAVPGRRDGVVAVVGAVVARGAGRVMRTWYSPSCTPALKSHCMSCSSARRARTLASAMPCPCEGEPAAPVFR